MTTRSPARAAPARPPTTLETVPPPGEWDVPFDDAAAPSMPGHCAECDDEGRRTPEPPSMGTATMDAGCPSGQCDGHTPGSVERGGADAGQPYDDPQEMPDAGEPGSTADPGLDASLPPEPPPLRADGEGCQVDEDCDSAHCAGGICCADGDCCVTASDCPDSYWLAPTCVAPDTCQGLRSDPTCVDFRCGMGPIIEDDSACATTTLSRTCGAMADLYCTGAADQSGGLCLPTCGTDDDCDPGLFCNASQACEVPRSDGAACDRDGACEGGRCQAGYCCSGGSCCATDSDCEHLAYSECTDVASCTGVRFQYICGTGFACEQAGSPTTDPDACAGQTMDACGLFRDLRCDGSATVLPVCPSMCVNHGDCDAKAACVQGLCVAR